MIAYISIFLTVIEPEYMQKYEMCKAQAWIDQVGIDEGLKRAKEICKKFQGPLISAAIRNY